MKRPQSLKTFLERPKKGRQIVLPDSMPTEDVMLVANLDDNLKVIQSSWGDCGDVLYRQLSAGSGRFMIVWIRTLIGKDLAQAALLGPLTTHTQAFASIYDVEQIIKTANVSTLKTLKDVNQALGDGSAVVLLDGSAEGLAADVNQFQARQMQKPELEPGVVGPQVAFTESLDKNLGLLRIVLKSPRFKIKYLRIGDVSKTQAAIGYVDGVAKSEIVAEVERRLQQIRIDGILDINYVREMTNDAPFSIYPLDQITERPDRTAAGVLQGRVFIMVDGSPYALLVPAIFIHFMGSSEDYYQNYIPVLPLRLLRHTTFWMSLLLPSIYIALLSYHQGMLPTALLITLAATHEGIPFPAIIEAFIMAFTFEALREAGIRLPKAVGQSVSIVGALVIGDAAVNAGIVSPGMVIVVALTGVASFTIPSYHISLTNRVLQFPFMILAGLFGLLGITIGLLIVITHLVSLRSYGTPYMYPLAPFSWQGLKQDVFVRSAWWNMRTRPGTSENKTRNATEKPSPRRGGRPS